MCRTADPVTLNVSVAEARHHSCVTSVPITSRNIAVLRRAPATISLTMRRQRRVLPVIASVCSATVQLRQTALHAES